MLPFQGVCRKSQYLFLPEHFGIPRTVSEHPAGEINTEVDCRPRVYTVAHDDTVQQQGQGQWDHTGSCLGVVGVYQHTRGAGQQAAAYKLKERL